VNIGGGIAIASIAGVMNGLFPLPMKANKTWAWENNWLPFSILSLAFFPAIIAWYAVPLFPAALQHTNLVDVATAILCGALVYTGSLLFGISVIYAGVALSFALLVGSMNVVGILVPRLLLNHSLLGSGADLLVLAGVVLSVVSVVLGFLAGKWKNKSRDNAAHDPAKRVLGSILATLGGILSGFLSVAMAMPWAHRLSSAAMHYGGASSVGASNAVLTLILFGGAIPNCCYCVYLLLKNRTYRHYKTASYRFYWILVLAMAVLYSASVALWGVAISPSLLGALGSSVGWAFFVGMIVISSTASGILEGEWRQAGTSALTALAGSLACLLSSMYLICIGNYYR
jgi:L-rhamnose-H+ transport protein